jgi:hypothetical protein
MSTGIEWKDVVEKQYCPYLNRKCLKIRKSDPDVSIGTCSVLYGDPKGIVLICPFRLLERKQIFFDALHLLTHHEPGNELHVVPEISLPGGSVDYFLVSANADYIRDFVGIELQTMDTTGTVWPERQRFLKESSVSVLKSETSSEKGFGINWKMTAKTTLIQLLHKIQTFQKLNRHLALVIQDTFLTYLRDQFRFDHIKKVSIGDPMHFHAYKVNLRKRRYRIELSERVSTNSDGIETCLGLQADTNVELVSIEEQIRKKMSDRTLLILES